MALVPSSPATIGTASLGFACGNKFTKLTIRNSDTAGKTAYISTNGDAASSANASHVLYPGDSVDITEEDVLNPNDIKIVGASSGTIIFWKLNH